MLDVVAQVPVLGSYSSALVSAVVGKPPVLPPTTRTSLFRNSVAVASMRAADMLRVAVHPPPTGSYKAALAKAANVVRRSAPVKTPMPPADNTFPLASSVAVPLLGPNVSGSLKVV